MNILHGVKGDNAMGMQGRERIGVLSSLGRICRGALLFWLTTATLPVSFAGAADLLHNSQDTGSVKWAANGGWGIQGGKYGKFTCDTCHEPDSGQIKNIRSVISSMNGDLLPNGATSVAVSFQNVTSMGNDRVARASSNRICEVCHSQNEFHNFNTANNSAGLGHPTPGAVCTSCHSHNTGFKASCGGCHGNPPTSATLGAPTGYIGTPRASNATDMTSAGAHEKHTSQTTGRGMVCDTCHYIGNGGIKMPNLSNSIQMGFFGFGGKVTSGTFVPYSSTNTGFKFASGTPNTTIASVVTDYAQANKCANVYCHGGGVITADVQVKAALTGGSNTTPSWTSAGQVTCGSCHGTSAANPPTLGSHLKHAGGGTGNYALECSLCHPVGSDNSHVQGNVRWKLDGANARIGAAATYRGALSGFTGDLAPSASYGQCDNLYCHSAGKSFTTPFSQAAPVTWGDTLACNGCHSGGAAGSTQGPSYTGGKANSHPKHPFTCDKCHGNVVSSAGTVVATALHGNQQYDLQAGGGAAFSSTQGNPTTPSTCASISCHSGNPAPVAWGATLDCKGCHGSDQASGAPMGSGKHAAHINTASNPGLGAAPVACVTCHADTISNTTTISNPAKHVNGLGNYSGAQTGRYASGVCSASYCHSDGKGTPRDMSATTWQTGGALDCKGCHGQATPADFASSAAGEPNYANDGANQPRANSHKKHVGTGAASCDSCHFNTTSNGAIKASATVHADGSFDVFNGNGAVFSFEAGKTCSNISCHFNKTAVWGANLDCNACHGGDAATLTTKKHGAHISTAANPSLGSAIGCQECHSKTVSDNGTIGNQALHGNGIFGDYSGLRAGKSYSSVDGTCTTYCHSDGKGRRNAPFTSANGWNSAVTYTDCKGCHGNDSSAGSFTSVAGEPNYQNEGGGLARANSHSGSHVTGGASSCVNCHNTTTDAGGAIAGNGKHLDGTITVTLPGYNAGTKSCSNVSCHGNGSPDLQWGGTGSCVGCHGNLNDLPGAHSVHIENLIASGAVTFYNYTGNKSAGAVYRFGCANCHPTDPAQHRNGSVDVTVSRNKAGGSYLNGLNSLADSDTAGYTRSGAPKTNLTCELVYCHSNGKNTNLALADYKGSPNWYSTTPLANKCGMCHDNPPQYSGQAHYVANSSLGNNGTPPYQASGHMVGIHFTNIYAGNEQNGFLGYSSSGDVAHGNSAYATSISCNICHNGIVSDTTIDTYAMSGQTSDFNCANCHTAGSRTPLRAGRIVNTALHLNGVKDLAFPSGPTDRFFKTKAQLANVANALGWTRNGSYKSAGSYDSADLGVSTWSRDVNGVVTCLTACHMNQPNVTWGSALTCVSCHVNQ